MYREQVSWWRRRARRPEVAMADVPERPARDEVVMVEARLALRDALLALRSGKRALLVLRYLAVHGGTVLSQSPSRPASPQGLVAPVSLRSPVRFWQVAAISNTSCPAGSGGLPGSAEPGCFYLTGTGMTVTVW